ncbi:MAG: hypothetical protein WC795_02185 [Candidatus Paceibacterota bacterium]|jgi:hypothetical protein
MSNKSEKFKAGDQVEWDKSGEMNSVKNPEDNTSQQETKENKKDSKNESQPNRSNEKINLKNKIDKSVKTGNVEDAKIEKTDLEILDDARSAYASKYKEHFNKQNFFQKKWNKTRESLGLGKTIEEKDLPIELQKLKNEYDASRVLYGKELFSNKENELLNGRERTPEIEAEIKQKLAEYKAGELFKTLIVDEKDLLNKLNIESLPHKEKGILRKLAEGYIAIKPRWKKVAIATAFSTIIVASAGGFAASGVAGVGAYTTYRMARGMASMGVTLGAGKLFDRFSKDKSGEKREASEKALKENFSNIDLESLKTTEAEYSSIIEKEKRAKVARIAKKGALMAVVGGSFSMGTAHASELFHNTPGANAPAPVKISANPIEKITEKESSSSFNPFEKKPEPWHLKPEAPGTYPSPAPSFHETEVDVSSKGAIKTFAELKAKLIEEYPDPSTAPADAQEIMNGDPTKLAIKYGFYKPGDADESALLQKGATLGIDENGNLKYNLPGQENNAFEIDEKGGEHFQGKFIDSDHSGGGAGQTEGGDIPEHKPLTKFSDIEPKSLDELKAENAVNKDIDITDKDTGFHEIDDDRVREQYDREMNMGFSPKVENIYRQNIDKIFGRGFFFKTGGLASEKWGELGSMDAKDFLKNIHEGKTNVADPNLKKLINLVSGLEKKTGLNTTEYEYSGLGVKDLPHESLSHWIKRAMQVLNEKGQLASIEKTPTDDVYN